MEFNFDKRVRVFSSEVEDGSMSLFDGNFSINSPKFLEKISAHSPIAYCKQYHSDQVNFIDQGGSAGDCDGALSDEDLILAIRTADCIPLMIVDGDRLGAIHCGRKSIVGGIIQNLKSNLVSPASAKVFLGPHIRVKNYEIKQDVIGELNGSKWEQFIVGHSKKYYFDLTSAMIFALDEIGIKRENITDCMIDTYEDERFFSLRRNPQGEIKTFITVIYKNGSE